MTRYHRNSDYESDRNSLAQVYTYVRFDKTPYAAFDTAYVWGFQASELGQP